MNRRTLLQAVGTTALTSLAGCAGMLSSTSESDSTTTATQTQGAIEDASIDGTKLVVTLNSDADIEKVNVIGPDGSPSLGSQSIPTGSTKASFNVLQSVPRGTHRIVAVSSGEEVVGEASVALQPNVEIDRVATWLQTEDVEWPSGEKYFQAYLELSNTGATPQQITFVTMPGVPSPWPKRSPSMSSGFQTIDDERLDNIILHPGETKKLLTTNGPFLFGSEFTCGDSTEFSVRLSTKVGENVENSFRLVSEDPDDPQKACKAYVKPQ